MLATFNNETNNVSFSEPTESEYEKIITVFIEQKINL